MINRQNALILLIYFTIFFGINTLIGCYQQRRIEFIPTGDIEEFDNWHLIPSMRAYIGPREYAPQDINEFDTQVCVTTTKWGGHWDHGIYDRPSHYEAKIKDVKLFFGDSLENEALNYEWEEVKPRFSGYFTIRKTCWAPRYPRGSWVIIPPSINELTIITDVEFIPTESKVINKTLITKMKRNDAYRLVTEK